MNAITPASRARREMTRVRGLKSRAVDAAMILIEAQGRERLNLRDIAARLETGPASLYHHFKNKDALLAEVAADGFRLLYEAFLDALKNRGDRSALQACCGAYVHFMRDRPRLYGVMYDEHILRTQPVARAAEQQAFQAFQKLAEAMVGREDDATDVAFAVWALGRGTAALCLAAGEPNEPAARAVAQRVVRGIETLLGRSVRRIEAGREGPSCQSRSHHST